MSREYLLSKSPDGLTAEERLFKAGQKLTKNGVAGVPLVVTGFIIAISGALLVGIDSDLIELASVFWVIGGLFLLHGQYLIWRYYHGLHCLERAELLHNTRMAYECHIKPTDTKEQDKKQAQQPVSKGKTVQHT